MRLLELLGLHATATRDEIKSRYRELARRFHPDVNAGDERAHARFRAIVAAYQELAAESDAAAPVEWVACTASSAEAERLVDLDSDIATPARISPQSSGGGFARQRAELRVRLDHRKVATCRAQAEVRDGEAKALAARGRGDKHMERHFERNVEADRSRLYALLGEVSGLELELYGLEAGPGGVDSQGRATHISSESESDSAERLKREVQSMHDEELAALRRKYENDSSRR